MPLGTEINNDANFLAEQRGRRYDRPGIQNPASRSPASRSRYAAAAKAPASSSFTTRPEILAGSSSTTRSRPTTTWILPTLPGWDGTERGDWMRSVRDLAAVCSLILDELGVGEATVVGLGFGGYIAAEMATANQSRIRSLVLVNAMGLQPNEGEIRDQFLEAHADYVKDCFADPAAFDALYGEEVSTDQLIMWDANREMTARVAWKPFLYSQTLPHLLRNVNVTAKVVRGTGDTVVPAACAQQYVELTGRRRTRRDRRRAQPRVRCTRGAGRSNCGRLIHRMGSSRKVEPPHDHNRRSTYKGANQGSP